MNVVAGADRGGGMWGLDAPTGVCTCSTRTDIAHACSERSRTKFQAKLTARYTKVLGFRGLRRPPNLHQRLCSEPRWEKPPDSGNSPPITSGFARHI